jgi:hypothetical protein
MTKALNIVLVCAILEGGLALAQELQHLEVFGAYSYLNYGMNGWEASLGYNINRWLTAEGDASGYYREDVVYHLGSFKSHSHFYVFGPRFNYKALFARTLFGAGNFGNRSSFHLVPGPSESANGFAMALGGGLEKKIARHFAVRGGVDWLFDRFGYYETDNPTHPQSVSLNENSFRLNVGIVYTFGAVRKQVTLRPRQPPTSESGRSSQLQEAH